MENLGLILDTLRTNYIVIYQILGFVSALLALNTYNPIVCLGFFISLICNSAFYLVSHGIIFIGFTYILIYVGAIAILFLFIIMLLNVKSTDFISFENIDISSYGNTYKEYIPNYLFIVSIFIGIFFIIIFKIVLPSSLDEGLLSNFFYNFNLFYNTYLSSINLYEYSDISLIGNLFYSYYFILFILIGYMLILSIIASIYLVSLS
jgi:NADH-ubiquinone oxidoreductase chain 6